MAELLQLGDNAVCYVGNALSQEQVHRVLEDVQLVLDGHVDEVGVQQQSEGRPQGGVVAQE